MKISWIRCKINIFGDNKKVESRILEGTIDRITSAIDIMQYYCFNDNPDINCAIILVQDERLIHSSQIVMKISEISKEKIEDHFIKWKMECQKLMDDTIKTYD